LRAAGVQVVTMAEHYGRERAQLVADVDWIAETSQRGWLAFHLDARIRRRHAEAEVVIRTAARMFCVANGNLTGAQTAERFTNNLDAIMEAAQEPGPYVYGVYADRIERLKVYRR
jgi:hypothetical protein